MNYIAWALYAEGSTDVEYFRVLIPKILNYLLLDATGQDAEIPEQPVAVFGNPRLDFNRQSFLICQGASSFQLLFVHTDTGGRALQQQVASRSCALCDKVFEQCEFRKDRCVIVTPKKEMEAWTLADKNAIRLAFGLSLNHQLDDLSDNAETIHDPKLEISRLLPSLRRGSTSTRWPYESIAAEQSIASLSRLPSFSMLIDQVKVALQTFGYRF